MRIAMDRLIVLLDEPSSERDTRGADLAPRVGLQDGGATA